MLKIALVLFLLAAVTGLYLALQHFRGNEITLGPALAHGVLAATGLVVLLYGGLQAGLSGLVLYALILFVVAALGGFVLFSFHLRGKEFPTPVVVVHALVAVAAFGLLAVGVFL